VATPLRSGEPIGIDDPDAILKVVEDMRTVPKKDIRGRRTDSPSTFDKKAKQIMDTPLLTGDMTGAKLQTAQGETIYVGRRAVYLQNSYSTELIGKESNMLGKGGNKREPVFMHRHPVDSVRTYKTRNEAVKCRIVSASIIAPAGFKRARAKHRSIIDLGFAGRLRPATGSAF